MTNLLTIIQFIIITALVGISSSPCFASDNNNNNNNNNNTNDDLYVDIPKPEAPFSLYTVNGRIFQSGGGGAVADSYIFIPTQKKRTQSDIKGYFTIEGVQAGQHQIIFLREGYERKVMDINVPLEEPLTIYLKQYFESDDEVFVFGKIKRTDMSKHGLKTRELKDLPGTGGDAVKAIEALPGVSTGETGGTEKKGGSKKGSSKKSTKKSSSSGKSTDSKSSSSSKSGSERTLRKSLSGMPQQSGSYGETGIGGNTSNLVIRGSSPNESLILFDRIPIPFVYHSGNMSSIFNTNLIEKMDLYPGGFSVDHGNVMGGILDIIPTQGNYDKHSGEFDISLIKSEAYVEGPINNNLAYRFSARRSYLDIVAKPFIEDKNTAIALPTFSDVQIGFDYRLAKKKTISIDSINAWDQLAVNQSESGSNLIDFNQQKFFTGLFLRYKDRSDKNFQYQLSPYYLQSRSNNSIDDDSQVYTTHYSGLDSVFEHRVSKDHRFIYGSQFDVTKLLYEREVVNEDVEVEEGQEEAMITNLESLTATRLTLFLGDEFQVTKSWQLIPGFNVSFLDIKNKLYVDPRISTRYNLTDSFRLKAACGQYSQVIIDSNIDRWFGNPELPAQKNYQYGTGFELDITSDIELQIEGFLKDIRNLPIWDSELGIVPNGLAKIFGIEMLLKHTLTKRFMGWVAFTYLNVEEKAPNSGTWIKSTFDKPVDLTLVTSYQITPSWKFAAKAVYYSGQRVTPLILDYYDGDKDIFVTKYDVELINSELDRDVYQIDVRTDYIFIWDTWRLNLYLEIQNVTMATVPISTQYNYDYSEKQYIEGLEIVPFLGIRATY